MWGISLQRGSGWGRLRVRGVSGVRGIMQELPILQAFRAPVWGIEGLRDSDHCHETCQSVARGFGLRVQGFKHSGGCFPADWQRLGSKKRFEIVKSTHIGASGLGVPRQPYPESSARIMTYTMFPHSL